MCSITLLGPQRLAPTLVDEVDRLAIDPAGSIVAITAGWQEREAEDDELRAHLKRPVENLMLHQRAEEIFAADPLLFRAHRARQDELRELQKLYRYRLDFALEPARELLRRQGNPALLGPEQEAAIAAVRALDAAHLARIQAVHETFAARWRPIARPAVAAHRAQIAAIVERAAAVAIAGGHVAVLLNRLRLFGLAELLADRPLFLWSAGAMAAAERVVLFHDSPPQGAGNAEVLEAGLGLIPGLVPLPHARRRLRLGDATRIELFARRFAPARAFTLDEHACLCRQQGRWVANARVQELGRDGRLVAFEAAA